VILVHEFILTFLVTSCWKKKKDGGGQNAQTLLLNNPEAVQSVTFRSSRLKQKAAVP